MAWGGGLFWKHFLRLAVGIVIPHYKGLITLNNLVQKHVVMFTQSGCTKKLKFQVSTKDFVVTINSLT